MLEHERDSRHVSWTRDAKALHEGIVHRVVQNGVHRVLVRGGQTFIGRQRRYPRDK